MISSKFNIKSLVQVSGLHSYAWEASCTSYIVVLGFKCIYQMSILRYKNWTIWALKCWLKWFSWHLRKWINIGWGLDKTIPAAHFFIATCTTPWLKRLCCLTRQHKLIEGGWEHWYYLLVEVKESYPGGESLVIWVQHCLLARPVLLSPSLCSSARSLLTALGMSCESCEEWDEDSPSVLEAFSFPCVLSSWGCNVC